MKDLKDQFDGSNHIYTISDQHQTYHVRICHLEIDDQYNVNRGEIYLMSPHDDNTKHYCVYARIMKESPKVAELRDLILAYNCTDLHETPPKVGHIYVRAMTQFLVKLGITRIELVDPYYM